VPTSPLPLFPILGVAASTALLLSVLYVEPMTAAVFFLLVPLYLRVKRDNALDHFLRGRMYDYIESNPGVTYSAIRDRFALSNGTTTYHLAVLDILGYVKSSFSGARKCYFPIDFVGKESERTLTDLQGRILGVLRAHDEAAPSEVARTVGISRQRASYNLRKMVEYGLLVEDQHLPGRYRLERDESSQRLGE